MKSKYATQSVDFGEEKSNPRTERVIKITPHHMACKMLADDCARMHRDTSMQCSANYYIGYDGTICAGVDEDRRAWTSTSKWNDHRAITIEVSNDSGAPEWHIPDAAYNALVRLCADICSRYDIDPHYNGTTNGSITYHMMYASTSCPGPYLLNKIQTGTFERDIKKAMSSNASEPEPVPDELYRVQIGAYKIRENADTMMETIIDNGFEAYMVRVDSLYKVQCGAFRQKDNAEKLKSKLEDVGFTAFITTKTGTGVQTAKFYTVEEGDTLGEIAANTGTSVEAIVSANSIKNPDMIYVGQKIRIPLS